ncbi:DUF7548 family protein [Halocatena pleomorpha]|uniref:Uncharacterized protein n=1 Tax=Halocatena pleomorpha TaxID=1785090 RepID=A0A3P3RKK4_9EURY|nr:hypothetical protein [Halocatena pleomorpha]RRJ33428.1 hypothetical protein EIK79_01075 [Halocatena pleomorpha]
MDDVRLAPVIGIVGCVSVVLALAIPYAILSPTAANTYYTSGAFNPLFAGLFALVCVVVFASGRSQRSDPALSAGICLVFGLFIAGFAAVWAVTVPEQLAFSYPTGAAFEHHRYVVVLAALIVPLSAVWYTRALNLL